MAWVTEEEYQAAKQVRTYEYLQTYQPGRLKKTRTRNEWQLQDHDSFKINEITSKWHWKSKFQKEKVGYLLSETVETASGKMQLELWNPYTSEFWIDGEKSAKSQKYKITEIVHPVYPKLHRIQALRDVNETVKEGDLGGYVQREWNLSQSGTSWIYEDAICEDLARVQGDASLRHHARASGKSFVAGKTEAMDYSQIRGYAYVKDAQIKDRAIVCGEAVVESLRIAKAFPVITGESRVRGQIHGSFLVEDTSVSRGQRFINPSKVQKRVETDLKRKKQPER